MYGSPDRAATGTPRPADEEAVAEAVVRRSASLLLGPPDGRFFERLPLIRRALLELPAIAARRALTDLCEHAAAVPEAELRAQHARTFDPRRFRTLHLLDHAESDARRRRRVRVRIAGLYADRGWRTTGTEEPDHLAVVLEFAARCDPGRGERLLGRLRPGMERLIGATADLGTPYARALDAVRATLPPAGRGTAPVARAERAHVGGPDGAVAALPRQARGPESGSEAAGAVRFGAARSGMVPDRRAGS
ncbi:nitrate reductase molybdenum cofactor assembly chaperone [Streptomonospora wellingtoniae]|uniref:Molecular chaperone TorD family protein n=1 Tax=Streptomonospora wellingtoniae TaxID=3075544 RepID=A0ABU2KNG4_9ACTN|nr:molecular chaperone TorD family protein [Streptomonospora sp. DSM 45055]MDT0300811.1 molecular chaperone TorD family protein [Streptomonospora sp. DSM 45055]